MNRIYCISGLGADHRVFKDLFIEHYELVPVHWAPYDKDESLPSYAKKLMAQIKDKDPVILGLSLGGMLAVEMAKLLPTSKVIIISSAKFSSELRIHGGGLARWLIKTMIVPAWMLTIPNFVVLHYLGAKKAHEKKLLSQITRDSDSKFVKWALKALATWENDTCPANVVHIHGTADKTIPSANVKPDIWIEGGTHIMIYNRADEVSRIISECLAH